MKNNFDYKNNFYTILDAIPVYIYWKDMSGKYLGCNKYTAEMAGLSREDIIGKTDYDLIWKDAAEKLQKIDKEVIKNKKKHETEETSYMGTNKQHAFLSTKIPLYNSKKKVIGIIGVSVDITDRKKHQLLYEKEKKVSKQILQAMEILAENLAHDIKTPLATISIYTDNLSLELKNLLAKVDKTEKSKKIITCIENIKSAIYNANNVMNMLLIKLRNILNQVKHYYKDMQPISIKECINDAIKEYPFRNNEREFIMWDNSSIDFNYDGNQFLTKHTLFNLIKNSLMAIKKANKGKIYISLRPDKDFNYLIFKHTASGIPDNQLESIFKQFSNTHENSGLDLSFCKMTMRAYGGDIKCDSKVKEYTEFTLSFPKI